MENNILSGATYFGFSRMHHENRQEAWPWRVMRPLKQPGTQPGELIPDSSYHKDLVMLSLMIVLFCSLKFSVSIPLNSTFIPAPAKLNAYAKHKTFWPTLFKHTRFFWQLNFCLYALDRQMMVVSPGMADKVLRCLLHLHRTENRKTHASALKPLGSSEIRFKLLLIRTGFRTLIWTWNLCRTWLTSRPHLPALRIWWRDQGNDCIWSPKVSPPHVLDEPSSV